MLQSIRQMVWTCAGVKPRQFEYIKVSQATGLELEYLKVSQASGLGFEYLKVSQAAEVEFDYLKLRR